MIGERFGRWTVVGEVQRNSLSNKFYPCKCDCGTERVVAYSSLSAGDSQSCGCLSVELRKSRFTKHGMEGTPIYKRWGIMKRRCTRNGYSSKGITVCDRWIDSFENFYSDMGDIPFAGAQIDRIDNNKGYSPDNCRWTTPKTNTRNRNNNVYFTFNGVTKCLSEWAETIGVHQHVLWERIRKYGWTLERALTQPLQRKVNSRCV